MPVILRARLCYFETVLTKTNHNSIFTPNTIFLSYTTQQMCADRQRQRFQNTGLLHSTFPPWEQELEAAIIVIVQPQLSDLLNSPTFLYFAFMSLSLLFLLVCWFNLNYCKNVFMQNIALFSFNYTTTVFIQTNMMSPRGEQSRGRASGLWRETLTCKDFHFLCIWVISKTSGAASASRPQPHLEHLPSLRFHCSGCSSNFLHQN